MEHIVVTTLVAIVQSFLLFVGLILALRLLGRRTMAQLTLAGYLIIALLGSAVESALYAGTGSYLAGIASAATIMLTNAGIARLTRSSKRVRGFLVNSPMILVHDGQVVRDQMRRSHLTETELMQAIRVRGLATLNDVQYAVLEVDGSISVIEQD